ncbi:hypothetical protein Q73_01820 [Bacillus coahuilensis m2-6]|uniref:TetR/AcrR family transcriptional regulator n=1 Tax=Bacillus coahuilensis TaxID=408580 RepID=UPI0007505F3F|nr:TetR family transcriptional regulator [Bacillus coahuilensis]KUP09647.1 hypothetical protein Q73_01820 [Bacillus coahuilensis m2-6]
MTFERARNEENKRIRLEEIKSAAIKLFDHYPYHEITLAKIGKEINFTRANLYKYVSSKEDIYIHIMLDEIKHVVDEMEITLMTEDQLDAKSFAYSWALLLDKNPRYLKLFSLLFTILEQNATLETLVEFKNELATINLRISKVIQHNFPEFNDEDVAKLLHMSFAYIISGYSFCQPSNLQREATKLSHYSYTFPNFVDSFTETLVLIVNGMRLGKIV